MDCDWSHSGVPTAAKLENFVSDSATSDGAVGSELGGSFNRAVSRIWIPRSLRSVTIAVAALNTTHAIVRHVSPTSFAIHDRENQNGAGNGVVRRSLCERAVSGAGSPRDQQSGAQQEEAEKIPESGRDRDRDDRRRDPAEKEA